MSDDRSVTEKLTDAGGPTGSAGAGAAIEDESLSTDTVFDVLTDKRRRYVVHHLKQRDEPVSVRNLAEQVAAWENDKPASALTSQERKRVYVSLYQSHLSTLDDAGVVEYDDDAGTVTLSAAAADIDIYMEVVRKRDIPWNRFYLGLAGASALVLVLTWGDLSPFTIIPDLGWAAVILAAFTVSAAAQTRTANRMQFGDEGPPPELRGESEDEVGGEPSGNERG